MVRGALTALALVCVSRLAAADPNDLVLSRLATRIVDDTGKLTGVVGESLELRALASQLGVVLAPHLLTPADTLGFGGFQFDVSASQTTIDGKQPYWRARAGSSDPTGATGGGGPKMLRTIGMFAHKGMWFPLPSFELGVGAVHLVDSTTWTGQVYAKLGLHEGYHDLPLPSLAVRGAASRMMNQRELDLTVVSLDVTISKHFGIGGTWRFDPFAGWDLLMIIPRSEVIDATPNVDSLTNTADAGNNFVFNDQANIYRHRILAGAKFQYSVIQLTIEAQYALAGKSVDDRRNTSDACLPSSETTNCDAKDTAAAQTTVSVSAGFDF
jgi:hypothetical protein